MAEKLALGVDVDVIKKSFSDIFSGRVLAWQLGGTMLAALCFSALTSHKSSSGALGFLLLSLGFIAAYVILSATGTVVARLLATSDEEKGAGVAPLHFLIDNVGTSLLLPLVVAGGTVALAALGCLYAWPWSTEVGQGIMVFLSPIMFVLALCVVIDLFVLLFLVPAMIVNEQPPFLYALRRLIRLMWVRKAELAKVFVLGLGLALVSLLPVVFLIFVAQALCGYVYAVACGAAFTSLADFMLNVFDTMLVTAPICTVPLAFMNALAVNVYGDLVEDLDMEEEAAVAEENGTSPSDGEDAGLDVEGEENTEEPAN